MQGITMNALAHSKNSTILLLLTALSLTTITASASQNLPFRLGDEGTITFTSQSTATTAGTGNATLLGRVRSEGNLAIVGVASCGEGFAVEMQDTFTAANGDRVMTAITMQLCPIAPGIYHGVGTYVVTGGTGRFASATGSGVFDGTGNFNTGTIICALNGTISMN